MDTIGSGRVELRERCQALLRAADESALVRWVVDIARESLAYPAAAVALRNASGAFVVRASVGYAPREERMRESSMLTSGDLDALRTQGGGRAPAEPAAADDEHADRLPVIVLPVNGVHGDVVGVLLIANRESDGPVTQSERTILEMFAHAVSMALLTLQQRRTEEERVRTIETQKRQLEALLQASVSVHGLDLDEVLQRIAVSMTSAGCFQRAAVYLRDSEDMLHARASVGVPEEDIERIQVPIQFSMYAHLMRPEMQMSRSFLFDHRKHHVPAELIDSLSVPEDRDCAPDEWHPLDSLTIPLQDRDGRTIGLISLDEPQDRRYPDFTTIQVLELFAGACAVAVEQARLYDEIQRLAMTDPLTGLHNRRSFEDALRRELAHGRRSSRPCSILYCDLDGLKQLNDSFGHEIGDRALRAVADLLRARLREGDLAARFGGDEFVLLLPDTRLQQGAMLAEELRALVTRLAPPAIPAGIQVSVSIGVAGITEPATASQSDLVRAADRALYSAKKAGRNRVRVA